MAKYFIFECWKCKQKTSQKLVGYTEDGRQELLCEEPECKALNAKVPAVVSKKKTTWPYYHGGCGVTFESESHEKKYTQAHGMTKE